MRLRVKEIFLTVIVACAAVPVSGQDTTAARLLVRTYIDCDQCDEDYLREQVGFVNLVRDPRLASVTVLVTSLPNATPWPSRAVVWTPGSRLGVR